MSRLAGLDPAVPEQRRQLPSRLGIVFQHSDDQLFNSTVFDDVAFGPLNLGLPAPEVRRRVAVRRQREREEDGEGARHERHRAELEARGAKAVHAGGGSRTRTARRPPDFKSGASDRFRHPGRRRE